MGISVVDKTKIIGNIKKAPMNRLSYIDINQNLSKKYKYEEFLDFFISSIKANLTKDEIPLKLTKKLILSTTSIIELYVNKSGNISQEFINRINEIYLIYENYLHKNPDKEDAELTEILNSLVKYVSSIKKENNDTIKIDLSSEIKALNQRIEDLTQQITEYEGALAKKGTLIGDLTDKNRTKNSKIREQEEAIKKLEKEINELSSRLLSLSLDNAAFRTEHDRLTKRMETLKKRFLKERESSNNYSKKAQTFQNALEKERNTNTLLREEMAANAHELSKIRTEEEQAKLEALKNKEIDDIILSYLCRQTYPAKTLIKALLAKGYNITGEELFEHIRNLKRTINIETSSISLGDLKYQVAKPPFKIGGEYPIVLPRNTEYVDVVFTADMHICDLTKEFLDNYNMLLDYCNSNNIYMILDLGDFFDFNNGMGYKRSIDALRFMQEKTNECIEKLPKSPIYHALLGGNHDEDVSYLGEDFTSEFIDTRRDFISLGFRWAKVIFEKSSKSHVEFLLAHPHKGISRAATSTFDQKFANYDFSYLGHSHTNRPYLNRKYYKVTSLVKNNNDNPGFLHVRIYFNNHGLDSLEFKPLILERKLIVPETTIKYTP